MEEGATRTRLAVALLRRTEATLRLTYSPPDVIDEPLFPDGGPRLGVHTLDSLDVIEAMVAVEEDLGVRLGKEELLEAATLAGIAALLSATADPQAVAQFCDAWASVGQYAP